MGQWVNDKVTLFMQLSDVKKLLTSFYDAKMSDAHKYFCIIIWRILLCKNSKRFKLSSFEFTWVG